MQPINCILLIDRDNINNYVSKRLIGKHELSKKIQIATSCKEALEFIQRNFSEQGKYPQLVLMESNIRFEQDVHYRHLSAFLDSHKSEIQVVMLTNIIGHKDMAQIKSTGVDYILSKPLTGEDLIKVVNHFQNPGLSR